MMPSHHIHLYLLLEDKDTSSGRKMRPQDAAWTSIRRRAI